MAESVHYFADPVNEHPQPWKTIRRKPAANTAVELLYSDGTSDLCLWTGRSWLPRAEGKTPARWRSVPLTFAWTSEMPASDPGGAAA